MTAAQSDVLDWLALQPWAQRMSLIDAAAECRLAAHHYTMAPGDVLDGSRAKRMLWRATVLEAMERGEVDDSLPVERPDPVLVVVPALVPATEANVRQLGLFGG